MTTNIKTLLRVRPLRNNEKLIEGFSIKNNNTLIIPNSNNFIFDHCFTMNSNQEQVFSCIKEDLISCLEQSFNYCIFAYGQTGSGKSYTIIGDEDGVLSKFLMTINEYFKDKPNVKFLLSMFQVYNEKVYDLFVQGKNNKMNELSLLYGLDGNYQVNGLVQKMGSSYEENMKFISKGIQNRFKSQTLMNQNSSRSHLIFRLKVESEKKESNFQIIDLAGSERIKKSGVEGLVLLEAKHINTSLFNLGKVIRELSEDHKTIISYNSSILTKIMKGALGGNSKTAVIINISPSSKDIEETKNSLYYGAQLKKIKNKVETNLIYSDDLQKLKSIVEEEKTNNKLNKDIINQLKERISQLEKEKAESNEKKKKKMKKTKAFLHFISKSHENHFSYKLKHPKNILSFEKEEAKEEEKDSQVGFVIISGIQRKHCQINITSKDVCEIFALSENDVYVNGAKIISNTSMKLNESDRIVLGLKHSFFFSWKGKLPEKAKTFKYYDFIHEKYSKFYEHFKKKNGDIEKEFCINLLKKVDFASLRAREQNNDTKYSLDFKDNSNDLVVYKQNFDDPNKKTQIEIESFLEIVKKYRCDLPIDQNVPLDNNFFDKNKTKVHQLKEKISGSLQNVIKYRTKIQEKQKELVKYRHYLNQNFNDCDDLKENYIKNLDNEIENIEDILKENMLKEYISNSEDEDCNKEIKEEIKINQAMEICKETVATVQSLLGLKTIVNAGIIDKSIKDLIQKINIDAEKILENIENL